MRDRLFELLKSTPPTRLKAVGRMVGKTYTTLTGVADHLLANGVIVPPCKVGDTVYAIGTITGQKVYDTVKSILYNGEGFSLNLSNGCVVAVEQQLGVCVFLTEEEADKALAERSNR